MGKWTMDGVNKSDFKVLFSTFCTNFRLERKFLIPIVAVLFLGFSAAAMEDAEAGAPPLTGSQMLMFSSGDAELANIRSVHGPMDDPFATPIADVCNNVGNDFSPTDPVFVVPPLDKYGAPGFSSGPGEFDWKPTLDIDPSAQWLSNTADPVAGLSGTVLLSHDFTINTPIVSASLEFHFLIDNDLGDADDPGLLLNCDAVDPAAKLLGVPPGLKDLYQIDNMIGPFDITSILNTGLNTLNIYSVDINNQQVDNPSAIQYKFKISWEPCPEGEELIDLGDNEFECMTIAGPAGTTGAGGHEPPTIGKSLDGVRQIVDGGIGIDGQTWTVTQGYHQEFELLQMLTSPHTISNVIHCDKGVEYCNYIAVGFMALTDDFNNPVMTVSASKDHLGDWTLDWYDPDNYISDPGDATPTDITFVPQIIDNKLLGTSFTIDFKNKDTGQLKMGIQVRDSYNGVRNFFFNEGVEFIDADAYPAVETAFEAPVEVEPLCFGQNNPDRNSCQFAKMKDWATLNAEEALKQMTNNEFEYD